MTFPDVLYRLGDWLGRTLFELNGTPVTPASVLLFGLVFAAFYTGSRLLNRFAFRRLLARLAVDEATSWSLLRICHYVIVALGAIVSFQFIGIDLSGLGVVFGLLSVGIGFGLQNVASNFISGLILLFERPIKVGDRVTVGEIEGDVVDIAIRATTIRTIDNLTIIVPNSEFVSGRVINWSHGDGKVRLVVPVGVSYGSDLELVRRTLLEVGAAHPETLAEPPSDVLLDSFGDSSWNMKLRVWIPDPKRVYVIRSELNGAIVTAFRERGVEIPYPQRDLHLRSAEAPLAVRPAPADGGDAA